MIARACVLNLIVTMAVLSAEQPPAIDPLVRASAYGDKTVWSYHDRAPIPWAMFRPKDFGSAPVAFNGTGVRPVGRVPAPGVHPRIFFSPEDLPALRQRIKSDRGAQEAWKNLLAWTNALKLTYDEQADYAKPDWVNGSFHIRGRVVDLHRIGGYHRKREDYYRILAEGGTPKLYESASAAGFFKPAATEALRCLIEDDAAGAQTLAKATITAIRLEQKRRAANDKPVGPGEPPKPSTGRSEACGLGFIYDFIFNYLTAEQKQIMHEELVLLSAWSDNYGTFNNAEASRSNWATFSYWVFDLMAIEGEPGFNDLKFLGLYRGWRNFFTYSFFDSGAAYEAEGKLLFGLDAVVAFDRVVHKYGLEPLSQHPLPRSYYGRFSAFAMLPTRSSFAVFDILGGMGGGFTTPQDLVVAKYLFPQDRTTDFVYRAMIGDNYRSLPNSLHSHWNQAIISTIFATSYDPQNTPDQLSLPFSFFCGQRALMMTRSSWNTDATFLTMHVRGASGGHPYPDRGGLMLAAQGRPWVTIPGKDVGSWACSTVSIDGAAQNATTPGRVVDWVDTKEATFMTSDLSYCWNWIWATADKNADGKTCSKADVDAKAINRDASWTLVEQSFNDFAFTKTANATYQRPLKYNASWIAPDGALTPVVRQVNTPVLTAFRTAGLVRGARPYVVVIDDLQRDAMPARYDWNLTLMPDVVRLANDQAAKLTSVSGDVILLGKTSLAGDGSVKDGEPALLIRVLDAKGRRLPEVLALRDNVNLLTISTVAPSPEFKVLIHAFRIGEALPKTTWDAAGRSVSVAFPQQEDVLTFTAGNAGRTNVVVQRAGKIVAAADHPLTPFVDPATEALTQRQRQIGPRFQTLQAQRFAPTKLDGFFAGWRFTDVGADGCLPVVGSAPSVRAVTLPSGAQVVDDGTGRKAVAIAADPLLVPVDGKDLGSGAITLSIWVKTKPSPFMGRVFEAPGITSFGLVQGNLWFGFPGPAPIASWSSAVLPSWTHIVVTWDGTTVTGYRNGIALTTANKPRKAMLTKPIVIGGNGTYGNAEVQVRDLMLYRSCLPESAVFDLYLWQRFGDG